LTSTVTLQPKKVTKFLLFLVIFLTIANIAGIYSTFYLGHNKVKGLVPLFNVGRESSIPTYYSSITLLICAILIWFIALSKKEENNNYTRHWQGLSIIFLYLSIDEGARIHEWLSEPIRDLLSLGGFFYYSWVIPYIILALLFISIYYNFLLDLPTQTKRLFVISGGIFVLGALGLELVEGQYYYIYMTHRSVTFNAFVAIEEFLEMFGILIFIHALLDYLQLNVREIKICFS
jgi:hypothetical protein